MKPSTQIANRRPIAASANATITTAPHPSHALPPNAAEQVPARPSVWYCSSDSIANNASAPPAPIDANAIAESIRRNSVMISDTKSVEPANTRTTTSANAAAKAAVTATPAIAESACPCSIYVLGERWEAARISACASHAVASDPNVQRPSRSEERRTPRSCRKSAALLRLETGGKRQASRAGL